jgi:hypothetical protein
MSPAMLAAHGGLPQALANIESEIGMKAAARKQEKIKEKDAQAKIDEKRLKETIGDRCLTFSFLSSLLSLPLALCLSLYLPLSSFSPSLWPLSLAKQHASVTAAQVQRATVTPPQAAAPPAGNGKRLEERRREEGRRE